MKHLRFASAAGLAAVLSFGSAATPAFAVNKDLLQLQTEMRQLQEAVARLQQANDERMGVLRDLVQQSTDSINKMSIVVNGLQLRMQNQGDAFTAKSDQLSGQMQSLNDSVDELKARLTRMEKSLGDVQSQQQTTNAMLGNLPGTGGVPSSGAPGVSGAPAPTGGSAGNTSLPPALTSRPAPVAGPSAGELYRSAYGDYMSAKYPLATSEFQDLIKAYPDDNLSGNAYFYLGEIDARSARPSAAVKNFDHVIERYPDNTKVPAAHLHKGEALVAVKQNDAASRELRALIARFPNSPEAAQARTRLPALNTARR